MLWPCEGPVSGKAGSIPAPAMVCTPLPAELLEPASKTALACVLHARRARRVVAL